MISHIIAYVLSIAIGGWAFIWSMSWNHSDEVWLHKYGHCTHTKSFCQEEINEA